MEVRLLLPDRDPRWREKPDPFWEDRYQDLNLAPVLEIMGGEDRLAGEVCRQLLDSPLQKAEEIQYRQEILRECMDRPELLHRLYAICQGAEEKRKNTWYRMTSPHLTTVYSSAADLLQIYMETLVELRRTLEKTQFRSPGLRNLRELLSRELSEDYLDQVRALETGIRDRDGMLISARFGPFLQGVSYCKRQPRQGVSRLRWLLQPSYTLAERDMNGAKDLELRQDRAINQVANAMAQAAGSLQDFVDELRRELSFYEGALRLENRLEALDLPHCFPVPGEPYCFRDLCDGAMALGTGKRPVGNDLEAGDHSLLLITGANQGGKTTFLRSLGLCQLMAQCGLPVCAESCRLPTAAQVFTHFVREEDRDLDSGKLDEELGRMSGILDRICPGALVLSNESFCSTNDRDGSEILTGIVRALLDRGIRVFAVTHLIRFAADAAGWQETLSLRAERLDTGARTFRIRPGSPRSTAYGGDLYRKIFPGDDAPGQEPAPAVST